MGTGLSHKSRCVIGNRNAPEVFSELCGFTYLDLALGRRALVSDVFAIPIEHLGALTHNCSGEPDGKREVVHVSVTMLPVRQVREISDDLSPICRKYGAPIVQETEKSATANI